ncbi:MAG: hypothetical protein R6U32_01015 [Candidatus Woesearchaeota archaeon]
MSDKSPEGAAREAEKSEVYNHFIQQGTSYEYMADLGMSSEANYRRAFMSYRGAFNLAPDVNEEALNEALGVLYKMKEAYCSGRVMNSEKKNDILDSLISRIEEEHNSVFRTEKEKKEGCAYGIRQAGVR